MLTSPFSTRQVKAFSYATMYRYLVVERIGDQDHMCRENQPMYRMDRHPSNHVKLATGTGAHFFVQE